MLPHARLTLGTRTQYGYQTDFHRWARELGEAYDVSFVCLDAGLPKIDDGLPVNLLTSRYRFARRFRRWVLLLTGIAKMSRDSDLIIVKYFPGCVVLRVMIRDKPILLDFRSRSVVESLVKRRLQDSLAWFEARYFRYISVVSPTLAEMIGRKDARVIGIGADPRPEVKIATARQHHQLRLLYVGTLTGRRLDVLLCGFKTAIESGLNLYLDIVGSAESRDEFDDLRKLANELCLEQYITFHGHLIGQRLDYRLQQADIGLVHVPNEQRYSGQPSTKLFEYWASGLPVLASDYPENRSRVRPDLGELYDFSASGFASGISRISRRMDDFSHVNIVNVAMQYAWQAILERDLLPYVRSILRAN